LLVLASDHLSPATGKTPTVTLSKNGGAFASPAGAVSEISGGWYKVAGNATDTNTLGPLALHVTEASSDNSDLIVANIVAINKQDAVRMGLTALPNVASGSAGALPTTGTGANQINVDGTGCVDSNTVKAGAAGAGTVILPRYIGTAQGGTAATITLANGTTNLQCAPGDLIIFAGATGQGESGYVQSTSGMGTSTPVATMVQPWLFTIPDSTTKYEIIKTGALVPQSVPIVNARVDTNLSSLLGTTLTGTGAIGNNVRPIGIPPG